jgi:hypothetical protein
MTSHKTIPRTRDGLCRYVPMFLIQRIHITPQLSLKNNSLKNRLFLIDKVPSMGSFIISLIANMIRLVAIKETIIHQTAAA